MRYSDGETGYLNSAMYGPFKCRWCKKEVSARKPHICLNGKERKFPLYRLFENVRK